MADGGGKMLPGDPPVHSSQRARKAMATTTGGP
jgi:hypothetical protein